MNKRFQNTRKIGFLGILANLALFICKLVVGFIFKSQSMIADSFNSIGDVFASLMTFIGNKIASGESDDDHNFGHGKAEYIFSLFISISILIIGIKLLFDSIYSIVIKNEVIFSYHLILVCLMTIIIKTSLYFYTKKYYLKDRNILLKSSMIDHRNDVFLTCGVLISILFSKFNIHFVDSIIGVLISLSFLLSGIKLFKESYNVLMDISLDLETKDKILNCILNNNDIILVDDIYSVAIGDKYIVVLTISVSGEMKTFDSHDVASRIERDIKNKFENIKEVFIHIHPI